MSIAPEHHLVDPTFSLNHTPCGKQLLMNLLLSRVIVPRRKSCSFPFSFPIYHPTVGRIMLLLNIVLEMIEKLDSTIILGNAQHILSFIAHTLEPKAAPAPSKAPVHSHREATSSSRGLRLDDLRIVDSDDEDEVSEDENGESEIEGQPTTQDLLFTALNLLLAVLEGAQYYFSKPPPWPNGGRNGVWDTVIDECSCPHLGSSFIV